MSEKIKSDGISRRRGLSLLGLAAAFCLAAPATMLTVSEAEAQADKPAVPVEKTGPQRRQERREHRRERRHERRAHRRDRREERREHRRERREERRTGTEEKK